MPLDRPTSDDDRKDAPGGERALKQGCACPVLDNSHGYGYLGVRGIFVIANNCVLHGRFDRQT